jgi:hypothetical protein
MLDKEMSSNELKSGVRVAFSPTYPQACWHFTREELNGKETISRTPDIKGAISVSGQAWVYWHYDFIEKKLKVQRVVLIDRTQYERNVQELGTLLFQALGTAMEWGLEQVIIWNPCEELEKAAHALALKDNNLDVVVEERESSSIPSLRIRGGKSDDVIWHANEYYAWC